MCKREGELCISCNGFKSLLDVDVSSMRKECTVLARGEGGA